MRTNSYRRWPVFAILLAAFSGVSMAAEREWTGGNGKFNMTAEFVSVQGDNAVLRRKDGKQIKVPLSRLSDADRAFIEEQQAKAPKIDRKAAANEIAKTADEFFSDLRNTERQVARKLLTEKAQKVAQGKNSPFTYLPTPAPGARSIRTGKVELEGSVAAIPVRVRAGGRNHKTKLHLRYLTKKWQVFAISATYPDGEKSINFEVEAVSRDGGDPLEALLGKPLELAGMTTNGTPLNMANFEGRVVLVDFWATWCGPCRAEMPNILENYNKYHDDGFDVIAISVDDNMQELKSFLQKQQFPWTVVADNFPGNRNPMGDRYGISRYPTFILLDKDGNVASVNCRGRRLGREVARLLDK